MVGAETAGKLQILAAWRTDGHGEHIGPAPTRKFEHDGAVQTAAVNNGHWQFRVQALLDGVGQGEAYRLEKGFFCGALLGRRSCGFAQIEPVAAVQQSAGMNTNPSAGWQCVNLRPRRKGLHL